MNQRLVTLLLCAVLQTLSSCGDSTAPDPAGRVVWTSVATLPVEARGGRLSQIWGSSPTDIWVVGSPTGLYHYDGTAWSPVAIAGTPYISYIWGRSATDLWAVGSTATATYPNYIGTILHYDGTNWSTVSSVSTTDLFRSVWASSGSNVLVGAWSPADVSRVAHYDGTSWSNSYQAHASSLVTIWGASPSDVWAIGFIGQTGGSYSGSIMHYDGASWSAVVPTVSRGLFGLWGFSSSFVVAVGRDEYDGSGIALTYDGKNWSTSWTGNASTSVVSVWGTSETNVWAVGEIVLHFDGKRWSTVSGPSSDPPIFLNGVWTSSPGDVWAVGWNQVYHGVIPS